MSESGDESSGFAELASVMEYNDRPIVIRPATAGLRGLGVADAPLVCADSDGTVRIVELNAREEICKGIFVRRDEVLELAHAMLRLHAAGLDGGPYEVTVRIRPKRRR